MRKPLLACVLAAATCASAQTVLPFTTARSLLLVNVTIDGHEKTLIFDTGAERTLVQDMSNVEHVSTVTVGSRRLRNFPIAYVNLAGMQLEKVNADGVLGQDVLRRFNTVHVDYKTHTITLE